MSSPTPFKTGVQYGFFFDQSRCIGCRACSIACKDWNDIDVGPEKWLKVYEFESGTFPNISDNIAWVPCYHCENPVCIPAANGAMMKEPNYGAVLIDPDKATTANLKAAWDACPYGAILFDSDAPDSTASKCTMCIDRLSQNKLPACVEVCPMRALDFGPLTDLQAKYGTAMTLPGLPDGKEVKPAVVFKVKPDKRQVVPYDASRALQLLGQRRSGLPNVYDTASDVASDLPGRIAKTSPLLKPESTSKLMAATMNDE